MHVDAVVPVGLVPDEVLLHCGRAASAPSAWWTPGLAGLSEDEVARRLAAAGDLLDDTGVRRPGTRELRGLLGEVAAVVAAATVLLLIESVGADARQRRSVVAAPDRALLDLQEPRTGLHDLVLAAPAAASVLLCELLAAGTGRQETIRIVRTRRGGASDATHVVTVMHHDTGSVACWTLPDGDVHAVPLDHDEAVVDLALALLGVEDVGAVA